MNAKRLLVAVCSAGLMGFCMSDTISQNVVGYASTGKDAPRSGRIVNLFKRTCGYGEPTLKEAISANVEGIIVRFYDGSRWQRAVSALDANDEVCWCDASTGDSADEYTCPHGAAIDYKLPDGEPEATLTFAGEADLAAAESSVGSMFSEGVTINDIKVSREAVRRIVGYPAPRKTEVVSVTNMPPTRFRIRLRDGRTIPARFDYLTFKIVNPLTGGKIAVTPDMVQTYEVDDDKSIPDDDRMDEDRVTGLRNIYAQRYKDDKAEREKAKEEAVVSNVTAKVESKVREEVKTQVEEATSKFTQMYSELKERLEAFDKKVQRWSDWWLLKVTFWLLGVFCAYHLTKHLNRKYRNKKARESYVRRKAEREALKNAATVSEGMGAVAGKSARKRSAKG